MLQALHMAALHPRGRLVVGEGQPKSKKVPVSGGWEACVAKSRVTQVLGGVHYLAETMVNRSYQLFLRMFTVRADRPSGPRQGC